MARRTGTTDRTTNGIAMRLWVIGTIHHDFTYTIQEGLDAVSDVILNRRTRLLGERRLQCCLGLLACLACFSQIPNLLLRQRQCLLQTP